jgi:hypothetical protein
MKHVETNRLKILASQGTGGFSVEGGNVYSLADSPCVCPLYARGKSEKSVKKKTQTSPPKKIYSLKSGISGG